MGPCVNLVRLFGELFDVENCIYINIDTDYTIFISHFRTYSDFTLGTIIPRLR